MRLRSSLLAAVGVGCALVGVVSTPASAAPQTRNVNVATGRCLDSNGGGNVYTLGCNGGNYQLWSVEYDQSGGAEVKNVATGRCLDSNGNGNVYTLGCNGGNYQRWRAHPSGDYIMVWKNIATGRCLDSNGNGNVYTLGCNGGNYQRWGL
ncbi:RICIN domain-containing protein [Streptomyces sp. HSW2009]|uniref:RICIN domain-containing protein n=1 Tax=Streptomyces sp. HSW2009 TaxID=3142890 RepID=UPI0032EE975C